MKGFKALVGGVRYFTKKNSPELLLGVGIVGIVGSMVLACKATLKANDILEERLVEEHHIEECVLLRETSGMDYSVTDEQNDRKLLTVKTFGKFVRLYGPSATLLIASIGCVLGAHNIMKKRNVALMAAYKVIEEAFANYRKRVAEELGEEKDAHFLYGTADKEREIYIDEEGKEQNKPILPHLSGFSRIFGEEKPTQYGSWEGSTQWSTVHDYNLDFLDAKMAHFNAMLLIKGFVTMNDVYTELGFPTTEAGMICGWKYKSDRGDGYISFQPRGIDGNWAYGMNGDGIVLDFNIDGVIFDQGIARTEMLKG